MIIEWQRHCSSVSLSSTPRAEIIRAAGLGPNILLCWQRIAEWRLWMEIISPFKGQGKLSTPKVDHDTF